VVVPPGFRDPAAKPPAGVVFVPVPYGLARRASWGPHAEGILRTREVVGVQLFSLDLRLEARSLPSRLLREDGEPGLGKEGAPGHYGLVVEGAGVARFRAAAHGTEPDAHRASSFVGRGPACPLMVKGPPCPKRKPMRSTRLPAGIVVASGRCRTIEPLQPRPDGRARRLRPESYSRCRDGSSIKLAPWCRLRFSDRRLGLDSGEPRGKVGGFELFEADAEAKAGDSRSLGRF
jgi:hypothetical protein